MGSWGTALPAFVCPECGIKSIITPCYDPEYGPAPCTECRAHYGIYMRSQGIQFRLPTLALAPTAAHIIAEFLDGPPRLTAQAAWKRAYYGAVLLHPRATPVFRQFTYYSNGSQGNINATTDIIDHILDFVTSVQHVETPLPDTIPSPHNHPPPSAAPLTDELGTPADTDTTT